MFKLLPRKKKRDIPIDRTRGTYSFPKKKKSDYKKLRNQKSASRKLIERIWKVVRFLLNKKLLKVFLVISFLITFVVFAWPKIKVLPIFELKKIEVIGNNEIKSEDVTSFLSDYIGRSIFDISESEVRNKLKARFDFINQVFIRESIKGDMTIEIQERYPVGILVDDDSVYLLDDGYYKLQSLEVTKIELKPLERSIITNQYSIDESLLKPEYEARHNQEGDKLWKDLTTADKNAFVGDLKRELASKVDSYVSTLKDELKPTKFSGLTILVVLGDTNFLNELEEVDNLKYCFVISENLKSKNLTVSYLTWDSKYTVVAKLDNNRDIWISTRRSLKDQLSDLSAIIWNNQLSENKVFDLRTANYSIRDK